MVKSCQTARYITLDIHRFKDKALNEELQIPCVMTSPTVTNIGVSTHTGDTHQVFIGYGGDIHVTRVTVDKFEFLESLNYLGSNLGLWPGLGLYQLIEGAVAFILSLSLAKVLLDKIKCRL